MNIALWRTFDWYNSDADERDITIYIYIYIYIYISSIHTFENVENEPIHMAYQDQNTKEKLHVANGNAKLTNNHNQITIY